MSGDNPSLVRIVQRFNREHGHRVPYAAAWKAAVAGKIPAYQSGNRWHVRVEDVALVEATLAKAPTRAARRDR